MNERMSHPLAAKIESAWQAKVNLDFEQCLRLLTELKQELRIPGGPLDPGTVTGLMAGDGAAAVVDVLLLQASLSRLTGDTARGRSQLAAIEAAVDAAGVIPSFRLYYERGTAAYVHGDFHLALEEFLRASLFADSELHKLWALGNALLTMENLGLPYDRTFAQVAELMDRLRADHDIERVERQMHALSLRNHFRAGRIRQLFQADVSRDTGALDQGRDFTHWVRLLPYHAYHRGLTAPEIETYSSESTPLHFPFFRLRTLQGVLHPEDTRITKPSEWADRLYLWVWLWLQDPAQFPGDRVHVLLQQIDVSDTAHRLTVEDAQLTRNALSWLGLFDVGSARLLRDVVSRLQIPRSAVDFPLLKLEWHVLQYLQARRDGEALVASDFRLSLEQNPLWRSKELRFRSLIEAIDAGDDARLPPALSRLARHLRQCLPQSRGESAGPPVLVDLVHSQIVNRVTGEKLISEAACLALDRFRRDEAVTCDQFVQICFRLSHFDPLIHTGKIFNLLSRIKRVLGDDPSFRMKAGRILVGGRWDAVEFREAGARVNLAAVLARWEKQLSGENPALAARPAAARPRGGQPWRDWDWDGGLTRADIEQKMGTPRSTTNRWIARWIDQGIVQPRGKARGTRYFLLRQAPSDARPVPVGSYEMGTSGNQMASAQRNSR